jgi:MFS family permease
VSVAALTILDLSKVNVALPSIEKALGAGSTQLQIVVSGYVLMFGLALVPFGRLGDQRSRKALFLVGLSLFLITSVVAPSRPRSRC